MGAGPQEELGTTTVVVSGESGGANLTLAVAHKAKREGCWPLRATTEDGPPEVYAATLRDIKGFADSL